MGDFPKPGIIFKDMFPLLANPEAFSDLIDTFADKIKDKNIDYIIGLESRGFLLGTPLAVKCNIPFIPIRKKGKLPGKCHQIEYALEYGSDIFEMQEAAISKKNANILIIDDLLATGGTLNAACQLV